MEISMYVKEIKKQLQYLKKGIDSSSLLPSQQPPNVFLESVGISEMEFKIHCFHVTENTPCL